MTTLERWLGGAFRSLTFVLRQLGHGLGTIFFIPNPWVGLILWIALLSNLRIGAFALLGLGVGLGVKRLLRLGDTPGLGGGIKANALLASIVVAWLTSAMEAGISVQIVLAIFASLIAAIVTAALMSMLEHSRYPVLIAGYCIVAACLFGICPQCAQLSASAMPPWGMPQDFGDWLNAFVRSMGVLVYSPSPIFGVLVCLAIVLWSPAAFVTGCLAWLAGVLVATAFQGMGFFYPFLALSYNYFISGMALGAVLFLPGGRGLLIAIVSGALTAFVGFMLQVVFTGSAISYLPISSITVIWLGIGALMLAGKNSVVQRYASSRYPPELVWCRNQYLEQRFGSGEPLLAVPVIGPLRVVQGFSGGVTHVGAWSHALDFESATQPSEAAGLYDHPVWGAQVIAPASGVVERIRNDVPDNPLGGSNFADNWGNHIVIRLDQGGWVVLAHLLQGSIWMQPGVRVEVGAYVGRVGNSGRSPVPHLHMQLQDGPALGSPTAAFRLANYFTADKADGPWLQWQSSAVPEAGALVRVAMANAVVHGLLSTVMPGAAVWYAEVNGTVPDDYYQPDSPKTLKIHTALDEAGRYRLDSGKGGRLIACLDPDSWRIFELERVSCGFLKLLGIAIPSIPYALVDGMTWTDKPPLLPSAMSLRVSVLPYVGKRYVEGRYECLQSPQDGEVIEVAGTFGRVSSMLPWAVSCRLERWRGVVRLSAEFENGTIDYSLLSFEPGLPSPLTLTG